MAMASGECWSRRAARAAAQGGTAARPRHQLLTCRGVRPVRRANAAWLDAGASQQGGEFGVQQRAHGALHIELSSIWEACEGLSGVHHTR